MDINDLHPPDDYSHRFFIWHEWIQANGPLTSENVFDYFATSMFYDKQSNNQVLRMQTMHTGVPLVNEAEELRRFTGIEFAVVHAQPPSFFIVQKRERLSPDEVKPLAAYFISNNRIYQSPDLYTVLSNRLLTSLYSLQTSLDMLRKHRPDYTPRTGFVWPIVDTSDTTGKKPAESIEPGVEEGPSSAQDKQSNSSTKQQNNMLLINAMRATAAHSRLAFSASPYAQAAESMTVDTPATSQMRSSATPGPIAPSTEPLVKSRSSAAPPEPVKGPPGGGKKKKKRMSMAAPPQT